MSRNWLTRLVRCASLALSVGLLPTSAAPVEPVAFSFGGRVFEADLYRPAGEPRGTVLMAHGFMRDRQSMSALAGELARRGAIVIVPDLPYLVDPVANAQALAQVVIEARGGRFGPTPAATVLVGFSAGGLSTLLATIRAPGVSGWIGLDPLDRAGEGMHAAARASAPALILRAAASRCNAYANSHSWGSFLPRLSRDTLIEAATHCDFENAGDLVCASICGEADPARQAAIRAEVAAAVEHWLH
jgi:pimeloyl-ACP methyl ester carboxylesterase